jgi:hypothetical protein
MEDPIRKHSIERRRMAISSLLLMKTSDEDFADQRSFPVGQHYGVIRLRVWPTTIEETQNGLSRLLEQSDDSELAGSLVIIGQHHIRVRRPMTG